MAITVSSNLKKANASIPFTIDDQELKGGFRCVTSIEERDAIPIGARRSGMRVRVVAVDSVVDYVLPHEDLSNAAWIAQEVGGPAFEVRYITDAAYTLQKSDLDFLLVFENTGPVIVTVPDLDWAVSDEIHLMHAYPASTQAPSVISSLTVVGAAGQTINVGTRLTNNADGPYSPITLKCVEPDIWTLYGSLQFSGSWISRHKFVEVTPTLDELDYIAALPVDLTSGATYLVGAPAELSPVSVSLAGFSGQSVPLNYEFTLVNNTGNQLSIADANVTALSTRYTLVAAAFGTVKYKAIGNDAYGNALWFVWGDLEEPIAQ